MGQMTSTFWHSFFAGVGQFSNPYDLVDNDMRIYEFGVKLNPELAKHTLLEMQRLPDSLYEETLQEKAMEFMSTHTGLFLRNIVYRAGAMISPLLYWRGTFLSESVRQRLFAYQRQRPGIMPFPLFRMTIGKSQCAFFVMIFGRGVPPRLEICPAVQQYKTALKTLLVIRDILLHKNILIAGGPDLAVFLHTIQRFAKYLLIRRNRGIGTAFASSIVFTVH